MNRQLLTAPFPKELVRTRQGQHGKQLSYIPAFAVVERLNEACEHWDFYVDEYKLLKDEVVVLGRLVADGLSKAAFGSSAITRTRDGEVVSVGDDLQAATSGAIQKAASLFGVGRELYLQGSTAVAAPAGTTSTSRVGTTEPGTSQPGRTSNHTTRAPAAATPRSHPPARESRPMPLGGATVRQLAALNAASRRHGLDQGGLAAFAQREAGKADISLLSRQEASHLLDQLNGSARAPH